jgi:diguanylate cyclase (GGDEF)-like protein
MDSEQSEAVAARLLEFVDRMEDVVGVCDDHGRVLYLNQAARKQFGVGAESELTTADFFAPEAFASYYDEVRPALLRSGTWTGELPILTQGGDSVAMLFSVVAGVAPGGEITGLVTHGRPLPGAAPVSTRDAGDNAAHIIDRDIVLSRLSEELERRSENFVAVVYAEVRDIRTLTQRHGGFVADGVMRTVGRRLTSTVRASDFVGRVGRNAFFVLGTDTRDAAEAMRLVQSLEDAFERELIWSVAGELSISLRCGLAIAERGDDPEAVLRRAQLASTSTAAPVDFVEAS